MMPRMLWGVCFRLALVSIISQTCVSTEADVIPAPCRGLYCGRVRHEDGSFGDCGACPHGQRPNNSVCSPCENTPPLYDWLYLGFMAIAPLVLHWFFIDFTNARKVHGLLVLHISAFSESLLAAVMTLLVSQPRGRLSISSCHVERLSDWYTMLENPKIDYTTTIHCTQEAVYPLYTIVMIYYAFCLVFMMLFRPVISAKLVGGKGTKSIYAALYFIPSLVVIQAVLGGLMYYSFPYILVVVSLITLALHLASFEDQDIKSLVKSNFTVPRNLAVLVGHWLLHTYGIVSITEMREPWLHGPLLALVPLPTLYYLLTAKFTDPDNLNVVDG
ncbi:JNK1/MAPK8-associated membrane protein [Lingula anatina]|uniref:JNK1/MAPK8-associated membrane protein n=2 Tax=Lingula anatina TaxID=7574 RepID=A0A1S3J6X0_LINAN|nr:JNK1/MAPK8-associated membrane protein [Lingula anatina]|eukprot:XP_013406162.1 JNK1/MAPK8-associated membrane protein [Lingula anatina]